MNIRIAYELAQELIALGWIIDRIQNEGMGDPVPQRNYKRNYSVTAQKDGVAHTFREEMSWQTLKAFEQSWIAAKA